MVNKSKDKDFERDFNEKKRRKSSVTGSGTLDQSSGSGILTGSKSSATNVYSNVVKFEEEEAQQRTANEDSELFHETCSELRTLFADIYDLKTNNTDKAKLEINEKRIESSFMLVLLKKLNRLDKVRLRSGRDALHKEKLTVDSNRLQLQNLLYEAEHLRKEVQRCLQFKSQDEEIDLVDESEFYEKAPPSISRPDKTKEDEHSRRLARLEWELQQRKELAVLCKELQKQKEMAAKLIEMKTDRLDSLGPRLDALLKATRPLQEALDMHIEDDWKVKNIARLLPRPLYLVYANLSAYSEACDKYLTTFINGDEYEAKQQEDSVRYGKEDLDENTQESDNEDNDADNERPSKSHHHRRQSKSTLKEMKKDNLFKPHPLSISFKVRTANDPSSLCVALYYLPALNIVTAQCKFELNTEIPATEVLSPDNILSALYADDFGEESSNPKTNYQLREVSLDPKLLLTLLKEKQLGKPYKWAQQLCGLEFVPITSQFSSSSSSHGSISYELAQSTVPEIVKKIHQRWQARLQLHSHITALEKINLADKTTLLKISSSLVSWKPISWEDYANEAATNKFIEEDVVTEHDLLYRAIITRGSAKLNCLICVSANYPAEMPLWAITLDWNDTHNPQNDSAMREMESWVNSTEPVRGNSNVLEIQLKRTLSCLDIYLETDSKNDSEFPVEKTFLKAFRTRCRSRPFKIIENSGSIVYTQI